MRNLVGLLGLKREINPLLPTVWCLHYETNTKIRVCVCVSPQNRSNDITVILSVRNVPFGLSWQLNAFCNLGIFHTCIKWVYSTKGCPVTLIE